MKHWYEFEGIEKIDSPALIVYKDRVKENIEILKSMVDSISRLRPHVKTHKMREVTELLIKEGIRKFKCATIAEAEMVALSGGEDILIAYQLVGPKIVRYIDLVQQYPDCRFSSLIDNIDSYKELQLQSSENNVNVSVYVDLNVGMNRTGTDIESAKQIYLQGNKELLPILGFHLYDGHIVEKDLIRREKDCEEAYAPVDKLVNELVAVGYSPLVVAGGTPTFSFHKKRKNVECSPGTFVFWDRGYQQVCHEQKFLPAALVLSRVISKPKPGLYCLDLGYKSIASENLLDHRAYFLEHESAIVKGQSEEHIVIELNEESRPLNIGEIIFAMPFHICPTVAMYDFVYVVTGRNITEKWEVMARNRVL